MDNDDRNATETEAGGYPDMVEYPADVARAYREAGYWTGETLPGFIGRVCAEHGDAPCVTDESGTLTYRQLIESADRAAQWLRESGIAPGDRVLIYMPNTVAFVEVFCAILRVGAVPVLALAAHGRAELVHVARHSGARLLVTEERKGMTDPLAIAETVAGEVGDLRVAAVGAPGARAWRACGDEGEAPHEAPPSSMALMLLSGGTTGAPKLIPRTHDDYLYSVRESVDVCRLRKGDVMMIALPCTHNFTLSAPGILGAMQVGAEIVMAPDPSPATCLELVGRHRITHVALVPPLLLAWLNSLDLAGSDLSSLRTVWVGGAKLSEAAARRVTPELGCRLQQVFGMAEGLLNYTRLDDPDEVVEKTQGRPVSPADEVLVVDDGGEPVPAGTEGHLLTRGPYTIRGYYRAPDHNRRSFTDDGFYRTGDLVRVDERGNITVTGRSKDIINRGGEKIAPELVENGLLTHPGVHDASVVGIPDEVLGEKIRALVIPRSREEGQCPTPAQLRMHLRRHGLASFSIPDVIDLVDEFPFTAVGKVDKGNQRTGGR
ncbi:(2,3-dihydroxybenzoyl)adenylate synthase [Corynebacterium sp. HMSC11E11]|nr:2,3-dihydroxybenzoate-AMP ligase [Corynebacterium freneyi]WJZ05057.1 2,3-dihydroxybenzoate-AMP ligase [Corynebacterium freneyi]